MAGEWQDAYTYWKGRHKDGESWRVCKTCETKTVHRLEWIGNRRHWNCMSCTAKRKHLSNAKGSEQARVRRAVEEHQHRHDDDYWGM